MEVMSVHLPCLMMSTVPLMDGSLLVKGAATLASPICSIAIVTTARRHVDDVIMLCIRTGSLYKREQSRTKNYPVFYIDI